jgi:TolB-like protein
VITALSRYPSLFVIARNSSFTFKGRAVDVRQVERERERVRAWRTALRCRPI